MSRVNYTSKFLLVIALVALPLLYLSGQWVLGLTSFLQQTTLLQRQVLVLHDMTHLIRSLEALRNISPAYLLSRSPENVRLYEQAYDEAQSAFKKLGRQPLPAGTAGLETQLSSMLDDIRLSPGSEGFRVEQVFQNAQRVVDKAIEWRQEVANRTGLLTTGVDGFERTATLLLNRTAPLMQAIGATQAFGTFFLKIGYVDSGAAAMLDQSWQTLDAEIRQFKGLQIVVDPPTQTNMNHAIVIAAAEQALGEFDQKLVQVMELKGDWIDYYQHMQAPIDRINGEIDKGFSRLEQLLEEEYQARQNRLYLAVTGILTSGLAIFWLLMGLFLSVKHTVRNLTAAARRVAHGDFETPIHSGTRDEMQALASALDVMRQQLKVREDSLRDFGLRDGLTGLRNRQYFDEALRAMLDRAVRSQEQVSLLLLDLDHFKQVNDVYGHLAGDAVLRHAAELFSAAIKRKSDIVARYGGEEFAVILPDTDLAQAKAIAEQLRAHIAQHPAFFAEQTISITASIGVGSICPTSDDTPETLIALADQAVYAAKHHGRNRVEVCDLSPAAVDRQLPVTHDAKD